MSCVICDLVLRVKTYFARFWLFRGQGGHFGGGHRVYPNPAPSNRTRGGHLAKYIRLRRPEPKRMRWVHSWVKMQAVCHIACLQIGWSLAWVCWGDTLKFFYLELFDWMIDLDDAAATYIATVGSWRRNITNRPLEDNRSRTVIMDQSSHQSKPHYQTKHNTADGPVLDCE